VHWRSSAVAPTTGDKLKLGVVLAVESLLAGAGWQAISAPFVYPEVVVGIAAVGTAISPFIFVSQMSKALARSSPK
jgi:hypothetical protein